MAKMPKQPKKPKRSASLTSWERYEVRFNNWKKRVQEINAAKRKKEALINKFSRHTGSAAFLKVA